MTARNRVASLLLLAGLVGSAGAQAEETPDLDLQGVTFVGSEAGSNEIVIEARTAQLDPVARVTHMTTVEMRLSADSDQPGMELTCDRGRYDLVSGDFVAEGNVRGHTGGGRRFATSVLRYSHDTGLVTSDVPVVIIDKTGRYRGGGFRYQVRDGRFQLLGGATVETHR